MKVVLLAYGGWGLPALDFFANADVDLTVVTYSVSEKSRDIPFWKDIARRCNSKKIPVIVETWPPKYQWAQKERWDLLFTSNWRHHIPRELWEAMPLGAYNLHRSLLPLYKGTSPIQRAIRSGESIGGVSIHEINDVYDNGKLISQVPVRIDIHDSATDYYEKIAIQIPLLMDAFSRLVMEGEQPLQAIGKEARRIDFSAPPTETLNLVRSTSRPFLNSYIVERGEKIFIEKACIVNVGEIKEEMIETIVSRTNRTITVICGRRGRLDAQAIEFTIAITYE